MRVVGAIAKADDVFRMSGQIISGENILYRNRRRKAPTGAGLHVKTTPGRNGSKLLAEGFHHRYSREKMHCQVTLDRNVRRAKRLPILITPQPSGRGVERQDSPWRHRISDSRAKPTALV